MAFSGITERPQFHPWPSWTTDSITGILAPTCTVPHVHMRARARGERPVSSVLRARSS
jgi:hypothetical protein